MLMRAVTAATVGIYLQLHPVQKLYPIEGASTPGLKFWHPLLVINEITRAPWADSYLEKMEFKLKRFIRI